MPAAACAVSAPRKFSSGSCSSIFSTYTVDEASAFCVTRNADVNPDDEAFEYDEDFRQKMKRSWRLAAAGAGPAGIRPRSATAFSSTCAGSAFHHPWEQAYQTTAPSKWACSTWREASKAAARLLLYQPFPSPAALRHPQEGSVLEQVRQRDLLLSYPFESMDPSFS